MATSSASVTLDRAYFETLLRKAQFHSPGAHYSTPVDLSMVTIPKINYDELLISAREYANLRRNLYKGGITDETLAILVNDEKTQANTQDSMTNPATDGTLENDTVLTQIYSTSHEDVFYGNDNRQGRGSSYTKRYNGRQSNNLQGNHQFDDFSPGNERQVGGYFNNANNLAEQGRRGQFLRNAKRSIQLSNLPDFTTHADVERAVKGGMLLDIHLRSHDRAAFISFLDENDANSFFCYARRQDLYIRGKRVEISWADRHFTLPNFVSNKIHNGATRNIVVRSASTKHTEESIRDDLEHIHTLVVISVKFIGRDAHISINSVHNAMYARTCMMSRAKYKGTRIEWGKDVCDTPIPSPLQNQQDRRENDAPKRGTFPINRFALLNLDGALDSSTDDGNTVSDMPDLGSGLSGVAA